MNAHSPTPGRGRGDRPARQSRSLKLHAWAPDEDYVVRTSVNGGFPEPPEAEPARVVAAVHEPCGAETHVRLPQFLSARAVRSVVCERCGRAFEPARLEERALGAAAAVVKPAPKPRRPHSPALALPSMPSLSMPALSLPSIPLPAVSLPPFPALPPLPVLPALPDWARDPRSRPLRIAGALVAAVVVVAALNLLLGSERTLPAPAAEIAAAPAETAPRPSAPDALAAKRNGSAKFVSESLYALALPAGWERVNPADGASFSATAPGGHADATLWIERDPKLSLADFRQRSLEQLGQLAPGARVAEQSIAPTAEASVVRLATPAPSGAPSYEVVLQLDGPYRYYLATTVMPGAPAEAREAVALIQNSLATAGGK